MPDEIEDSLEDTRQDSEGQHLSDVSPSFHKLEGVQDEQDKRDESDKISQDNEPTANQNQRATSPVTEEVSDSEDESYSSEDTETDEASHHFRSSHNMIYNTISDHTKYFSDVISQTLDSVELDKSLAAQSRLSGQLNSQNQQLIEKKEEVVEKIAQLQTFYNKFFKAKVNDTASRSKVDEMYNDIIQIEKKLDHIESGSSNKTKIGLFSSSRSERPGVQQKYPVEYNQACDKVLDRQFEI